MKIIESTLAAIAPEPDADSAHFWESLARGELDLPRCKSCTLFYFPPTESCLHCGSLDVGFERSEGVGRLYSWATVHVPLHPSFADDVPYIVVVVELEARARLMGRLLDDTEPRDGVELRLAPYRVGGDVLPGFLRA